MGQIWAALKGLGAIASLLSELLKWLKEWNHKREIDKADEDHKANADSIARAFHAPPLPGLQDPPADKPRSDPTEPPSVSPSS